MRQKTSNIAVDVMRRALETSAYGTVVMSQSDFAK